MKVWRQNTLSFASSALTSLQVTWVLPMARLKPQELHLVPVFLTLSLLLHLHASCSGVAQRPCWWHVALTHPDHTCPWQECGSVPLKPTGISHLQCCGFFVDALLKDMFFSHPLFLFVRPPLHHLCGRALAFSHLVLWMFFWLLEWVSWHTAMREMMLLGLLQVWMRLCEYNAPLLYSVLVRCCPADHTCTGAQPSILCTIYTPPSW